MGSERPTVLIVDDNAANRAYARATLEDQRYEALVASDGDEAVELATSRRLDCILMDIRMPGVDGIEAVACA